MKPFADKNKQIDILKSRDLTFLDENKAKRVLMRYGYYEVVNGYKMFLLEEDCTKERYKSGATFEHLTALYELDKSIRNGVIQASLEIELSLRTAISYTLAEDFGVEQRQYLYYKNFRQGDTIWSDSQPTNERAILLNKLIHLGNRNIEPLNHYRTNHGHIPPWILLKESTFGNLKYIFKLLKGPQKDKVISICYGIDISDVTDNLRSLFKDTLYVVNSFRNRAAQYRIGLGQSDLYTLSKILDYFDNKKAKINLDVYISYSIKKHCENYVEDLELLANEMNYPINELKQELEK